MTRELDREGEREGGRADSERILKNRRDEGEGSARGKLKEE